MSSSASPAPDDAVRRVLLTGFEPFDGAARNPSWDLAEELRRRAERGESAAAQQVQTLLLPVEFDAAGALLRRRLDELAAADRSPDLVVALGLADGTEAVHLERVGLNLRDARIPDNAGDQPVDVPVVDDGPGARFSTLRLKAADRRLTAAGLPAALSLSAGTFVCNDVLYSLLDHLDSTSAEIRGGFVHIPDLHASDSPVSFDQAVQIVELVIDESLRPEPDAAVAAGTLH